MSLSNEDLQSVSNAIAVMADALMTARGETKRSVQIILRTVDRCAGMVGFEDTTDREEAVNYAAVKLITPGGMRP